MYNVPHFDVHFYIEPIENIFALQRGTCGLEFLRCDQYALARKPVPSNYVPPNFQDLGLVAPAMGNHLVDPTTHELHGEPFTRHWIYGIYDGWVVSYGHGAGRPMFRLFFSVRRRRAGGALGWQFHAGSAHSGPSHAFGSGSGCRPTAEPFIFSPNQDRVSG